jgi:opacity protein-like surface antigen
VLLVAEDESMNARKFLLTAVLAALAAPGAVFAACSHSTDITNNSGTTLRIVELKSSYSPPFFESQWTGTRVIAPGATGTINWTSDLDCTDASGVPNHWDVKFFRANGHVHYCGHLSQSEPVSLDTPDLCFH